MNQTDGAVQALHTSADTITDVFNYTIQDTGGVQDTATLTITIHGADDLPQAVADTGTMTEEDAPTSFNVITSDTQDPNSTATNAITLAPPASPSPARPARRSSTPTPPRRSSATRSRSRWSIRTSSSSALGEHATVTVPYTLTGDAGETSTANLVVTVNGANDVPVAADDSGSMTEDQVGTFTVLTNDTLDVDHGAEQRHDGRDHQLVAPVRREHRRRRHRPQRQRSNQIVVTLGADFQHLHDGESATFDVAYTLHGDQPGDTSTATLHVTVNGANDAPVAANFTFNGANAPSATPTSWSTTRPTARPIRPARRRPSRQPARRRQPTSTAPARSWSSPAPSRPRWRHRHHAGRRRLHLQAGGRLTGTDSFTYTGVGPESRRCRHRHRTVTINVARPKVWYVNATRRTTATARRKIRSTRFRISQSGVGKASTRRRHHRAGKQQRALTGGLTLENNEQ